jgi:hypothetical protein
VGAWEGAARDDPRATDVDLYTVGIDTPALGPTPVEALNTPHDESACAVSPAGDFVYFASDRPDGEGGLDLYRSRRLEGAHTAPRSLGSPVNTPANELDPAVSLGGFGLHYAVNADDGAGYNLLYTTSREVFTRSEAYRARLDWAALWAMIQPYLLATLIAAALLLALIRTLTRLEYRRLTLLAKCLLASLLVHMLLMLSFAFWSVSTARADSSRPGSGTRVVLSSPSIGAGLAAQIRGELTSVEVEAAVPEQAEARQRQDSVETLPPSTAPTPPAPPAEVAASRIEPPNAPTVAEAPREAPANRAEPPEPDLDAASRLEQAEPLMVELPSDAARSARVETAVAIPVPSPKPAGAHRMPAHTLAGAPEAPPAVTVEPTSSNPLSRPGAVESMAEALPQHSAPRNISAIVAGTQRGPILSLDLDLPAMPSAPRPQPETRLAEAQVDVGGVIGMPDVGAPAVVALPVATAPGQAVPRAEVTPLAAAVDVAPRSLAAMPGPDAPWIEIAVLPAPAPAQANAAAVSFDLPVPQETAAAAPTAPVREADIGRRR